MTKRNISDREPESIEIVSFSGIDTDGGKHSFDQCDNVTFSDILNMRVKTDGSLETREGFMGLALAPDNIRGVWSGRINNIQHSFFVAGNAIFSLDVQGGTYDELGTIGSYEGEVRMIFFDDSLYIFDRSAVYRLHDNVIYTDFGYAPLIAKDWANSFVGEIYEPRNAVSRFARYSYHITSAVTPFLRTVYPVERVIKAYVNGELIDLSRCSINNSISSVNITELAEFDRVEIYVLLRDYPEEYYSIAKCSDGIVFGSMTEPKLVLCGGKRGNELISSREINREATELCTGHDFGGGSLYIPIGTELHIGDGQYKVTAACRHFDRLLIFTEGETWMSDNVTHKGESLSATPVNSAVGALSRNAVTMAGNSPFAVNEHGVFEFNSNTDRNDLCNAVKISSPIEGLIDREYLKNARLSYDREKNEILLHSTTADINPRTLTFVYSLTHKCWYRFDGIDADFFVSFGDVSGWVKEYMIFIFKDSLHRDVTDFFGGPSTPIEGMIVTNPTDLGNVNIKHLSSFSAIYDCPEGCSADVEIYCDGEKRVEFSMGGNGTDDHVCHSRRVSSGRFHRAYLRLCFRGNGKVRLHSLALEVRK